MLNFNFCNKQIVVSDDVEINDLNALNSLSFNNVLIKLLTSLDTSLSDLIELRM